MIFLYRNSDHNKIWRKTRLSLYLLLAFFSGLLIKQVSLISSTTTTTICNTIKNAETIEQTKGIARLSKYWIRGNFWRVSYCSTKIKGKAEKYVNSGLDKRTDKQKVKIKSDSDLSSKRKCWLPIKELLGKIRKSTSLQITGNTCKTSSQAFHNLCIISSSPYWPYWNYKICYKCQKLLFIDQKWEEETFKRNNFHCI